jgi:hypothetical protein
MVGEYFLGVQVDLDRRVDEVVGIEFNVLGVTEFRILVIPGPRRNSDTSVKVLRRRRMIDWLPCKPQGLQGPSHGRTGADALLAMSA